MKKGFLVTGTVLLTVFVLLFSGCTQPSGGAGQQEQNQQQETSQEGTASTVKQAPTTRAAGGAGGLEELYTGFMAPKSGSWVEYVYAGDEGEDIRTKMEFFEDSMDGKKATVMEYQTSVDGEESLIQVWMEAGTQNVIKTYIKSDGEVMCMSSPDESPESSQQDIPDFETPEDYDPEVSNLGYGTYTTPTGKTVNVAKYSVREMASGEGGETWVSSQVPFGMVKTVSFDSGNEQETMYLYDFGLSGAKSDISAAEREGCMDLADMMAGFGGMGEMPEDFDMSDYEGMMSE